MEYKDSHTSIIGNTVHKKCNIHHIWFPNEQNIWFPMTSEYFYNSKSSTDGFAPSCKICLRKKQLKYREDHIEEILKKDKNYKFENKQKLIEYNRLWRKKSEKYSKNMKEYQRKHPEKIKEYNLKRKENKTHTISKKEWENCLNYFDNQCAYCGLPVEEHFTTYRGITKQGNFHKEHVNHEGENDLSNCIPSCKSCNCQKNTYSLEEWYNENNIKFSQERLNKIHKWLNEDYKQYIKKAK